MFQPGRDDDLAFRFRTGPRRLRNSVSCACIVASRRDRSRGVVHVADAGAYNVPHTWRHDRPRKMLAAIFELMHGGPMSGKRECLASFLASPAITTSTMFRAFGMYLDGWARVESDLLGGLDGIAVASKLTRAEHRDFRRSRKDRPGRRRRPRRAIPTAPLPSSTKRWRHATAWAIAHSKRNCIGRAAKSCCNATPPTPHSRKRRS